LDRAVTWASKSRQVLAQRADQFDRSVPTPIPRRPRAFLPRHTVDGIDLRRQLQGDSLSVNPCSGTKSPHYEHQGVPRWLRISLRRRFSSSSNANERWPEFTLYIFATDVGETDDISAGECRERSESNERADCTRGIPSVDAQFLGKEKKRQRALEAGIYRRDPIIGSPIRKTR